MLALFQELAMEKFPLSVKDKGTTRYALFDGVEILTKKDLRLRDNRVGLLQALSRLFLQLADFSKFSI